MLTSFITFLNSFLSSVSGLFFFSFNLALFTEARLLCFISISSNLKKKIDLSSISSSGKKSFSVEKKRPYKPGKPFNKSKPELNSNFNQDNKKKNFARKFIEQQATKDFIKKENKPAGKSKLKLKGPVDKRDFKLTVSRAFNVEEIEIKQRSLLP